ncbi:MAG: hypothetical protein QM796_15840 [Chthoniobacteraceae bacterium]
MQTSDLSPETLNGLYRFATLLFGRQESATEAILSALQQCGTQMEQIRREKHSLAFLVRTLRDLRIKNVEEQGTAAAPESGEAMALAFSQLVEPGRTALALLYADLFPLAEIGSLLHISVDEVAEALDAARHTLAAKWNPSPSISQP